ncbi:MAG: tetratricopeptide repeat protein [Nitrospirae bacterium]|nr:tetratricopeptide repeat protein [Nitrospirota bacterium]MBI3805875.1 tetratricopeptide repeat protein [Candidatus Manganitrophaceae bacterium]
MSLIHEALKKAATEGEAEKQESTPRVLHLTISTPQSRPYFWISIGVSFLALLSFLFAYQYKAINVSRPPDKSGPSVAISPSQIDFEKKRSQQNTSATVLQAEEGQIKIKTENANGERALKNGINFYRKGEFDHAYEAFQKAVELIPSSPIAHNNLGLVIRQQGKPKEALSHYQEAIHLDSKYAEAENNIGLIHDQMGFIDEAIIHYKKAIKIKPEIAAFHLNYATLLERKGDFSTARKEYQLFIDLQGEAQSDLVPQVRSRLKELRGL